MEHIKEILSDQFVQIMIKYIIPSIFTVIAWFVISLLRRAAEAGKAKSQSETLDMCINQVELIMIPIVREFFEKYSKQIKKDFADGKIDKKEQDALLAGVRDDVMNTITGVIPSKLKKAIAPLVGDVGKFFSAKVEEIYSDITEYFYHGNSKTEPVKEPTVE